MKKIYSILLTAFALLALAPVVSAQMTKADTYGEHSINGSITDPKDGSILRWPKDNGLHQKPNTDFAYSKDISSPQSDGTYWIKLESFSTGSASYIEAAAPADIVLVLDLSSSMVDNFTHTPLPEPRYDSYLPTHGAGNAWRYNDLSDNTVYYIEYDGEHYRVYRGSQTVTRPRTTTYYYFYFDDNSNKRHYLVGDDVVTYDDDSTYPTTVTNNNSSFIYNKALLRKVEYETRLDALKRATTAFIREIEKNDKFEEDGITPREGGRLGNRISIITFHADTTVHVSLAKGELADVSDNEHSTAADLINLVNGFENGKGTRQDLGITAANNQLKNYVNSTRMQTASRTVVVFTDGEPYDVNGRLNTTTLYNNGVNNAYVTKHTYDATVYTVGLFTTAPSQNGSTAALWRFMNYMSSNAPNATDGNTAGDGFDSEADFYKDASGENADLESVFTEIAHQSGGSTTSLSAASSNVDVVSNSFLLPDNAETSDIRIFVAKLKEMDAPGSYVFYEEIEKGYIPDTDEYKYIPLDEDGEPTGDPIKVDRDISVALETTGDSATPNTIKVTGFDYSSCFCGPVFDEDYEASDPITAADLENVDHYQGFKIIIMIPIHMNPDAVGGPNVATNGAGSGIFINSEATTAFVPYESPKVSLPVNLHIKKTGLEPGESAKFSIERAIIPYKDDEGHWDLDDIEEDDWEYVSTVFVTRGDGASDPASPVVKVRGLPANINVTGSEDPVDVVYRVSEEPWGWSYTEDEGNVDPQYTVTSKVDNPFEFKNSKMTDIKLKVRHAESKATNSFDRANHVEYDDSKKRAESE